MGTNSIRENLSREDIISEIWLSLGADIHKQCVFLVVEGEDDIRFIRGKVNSNVTLFESHSGKRGVIEIVIDNFNETSRVIGLIDKDYDNIVHPQIFHYDLTCLELMLIDNNNAFMKIVNEFYNGELDFENLRLYILKELQFLSLLRKRNSTENLNIKITGIPIIDSFNKRKRKLDYDRIYVKLIEMNSSFDMFNLIKEIQIECDNDLSYNELKVITQGHDYLSLFAAVCRKPGKNIVREKYINHSLRCAYNESDFKLTTLYSKLLCYQTQHSLGIVS